MDDEERYNLNLVSRIASCGDSFKNAKPWLIKNFLLLGLATAMIWALIWPWPGKQMHALRVGSLRIVSTINVVVIFLVSGLSLKTDDLKSAFKAWVGILYGFIAILFITPCAGFLALRLPLSQKEFVTGLTLFACVPTTLASGVTMVRQAGGNWVLATLLCVGSNLLAVLTMPFSVKLLLQANDVRIDSVALLWKLGSTLLTPLVIGKILREVWQPAAKFATNHKTLLGIINNSSLLMMVWQTASSTSDNIKSQAFGNMCLIVLLGCLLHLLYLLVNTIFLSVLRLPIKEHRAVLIMAGQKTLPVVMAVLSFLPDSIGNAGLVAIPCIVSHISQLFIDTAILLSWAREDEIKARAKVEIPPTASRVDAEGGKWELSPRMGPTSWGNAGDGNASGSGNSSSEATGDAV